jgi:hypothetical protein
LLFIRGGSAVDEPEGEGHHNAHDQRGGDGEVEPEIPAFDDDVAREPTEPEPLSDQPRYPDEDKDDPGRSEASAFRNLLHLRRRDLDDHGIFDCNSIVPPSTTNY